MPIKNIVTPKNVKEQLSKLPKLNTPVMDDIYPASVRDTHPFDTIQIEEVSAIAKAVPVVSRGASSISLSGGERISGTIEPLPVRVNRQIGAVDLNRIKTLTSDGQRVWLRNQLDYMRKTMRATTEALCAQSLSGKIAYAMKTDDGLDTYEIDYGTPATMNASFDWKSANLGKVFSDLSDMAEKIEENGGGSHVAFRVGKSVFARLLDIVGSTSSAKIDVKVEGNIIHIGGYEVRRYATKYYDPKTKAYKPVIADNAIKAIVKEGFAFRYLAIDDIDAGLQALPLWLKTLKLDDPSAYKLIGESKPLPIPNIAAICDNTVTL